MKPFFSEKTIQERFTMILGEIENDVKKLELPDVVEIGRQRTLETLYRRYSLGLLDLDLKRMKMSEMKKLEVAVSGPSLAIEIAPAMWDSPVSRVRSSGITFTPRCPTTIWSPRFTWTTGTQLNEPSVRS